MTQQTIGDRRLVQPLPGGGFAYVLLDEAVRFEARYLRREHGQLHGQVTVQCDWAGVKHHNGSVVRAYQNLDSQPGRRMLAAYCAERTKTKPDDFDWNGAVD